MNFELISVIDIMIEFYQKPRNIERFEEYLKILQGNSKDTLSMPVTGFNPMAKDHILGKLKELKSLRAEEVVNEVLYSFNRSNSTSSTDYKFKIAINLLDDSQGGWTNRYTSDYESKFRFHGLFNKRFCSIVFWGSESITTKIIRERTLEYIYRTVYWHKYPKPNTLKQHLNQEIFVASQVKNKHHLAEIEFNQLSQFYRENEETKSFSIIFNFFYGDPASASLAYPTYGVIEAITGFDYAIILSKKIMFL